jgi:acyl-CoA thioester hydrolase
MGVRDDDEGMPQHAAKDGSHHGWPQPARRGMSLSRHPERLPPVKPPAVAPDVSETLVRVNYSETDQMGVVYHARYLVWLDVARTEHLRLAGMSYRELEEAGLRLAVSELSVRYRQPARYDDRIRIRCWVRDLASRRIDFGYAVERADDGRLLATAFTSLLALDRSMSFTRLPDGVRRAMRPIPDPVSLHGR